MKISLLKDKYISERLFELGKIFGKDKYVPFQTSDYLGKVFYVICTSMKLETFGNLQGWINIKLRTSAPYAFSPKEINVFDIVNKTSNIELYNKSNVVDFL